MFDFLDAPKLNGLYVGKPKRILLDAGMEMYSGICKIPVEEAMLRIRGFDGDGVADKVNHGGSDRAVCVYCVERYKQWNEEFEATLPQSSFGENLLVENMVEEKVHIGDIFQVGDAVIQVTKGRVPCNTINKRTGIKTLMKRIIQTGYTGYLCRVLEEGPVTKDSEIRKLQEDPHGISVLYANTIYLQPRFMEGIERVLAVPALAEDWRQKLEQRIAKATGHGNGR
jgi:MOSC domain-containing protein YiiM